MSYFNGPGRGEMSNVGCSFYHDLLLSVCLYLTSESLGMARTRWEALPQRRDLNGPGLKTALLVFQITDSFELFT